MQFTNTYKFEAGAPPSRAIAYMRRLTVVTAAFVPLMKQIAIARLNVAAAAELPVERKIISVIGMPVELASISSTLSRQNKTTRRNTAPLRFR
jgi:hypothetical protein